MMILFLSCSSTSQHNKAVKAKSQRDCDYSDDNIYGTPIFKLLLLLNFSTDFKFSAAIARCYQNLRKQWSENQTGKETLGKKLNFSLQDLCQYNILA